MNILKLITSALLLVIGCFMLFSACLIAYNQANNSIMVDVIAYVMFGTISISNFLGSYLIFKDYRENKQ